MGRDYGDPGNASNQHESMQPTARAVRRELATLIEQ
jgi:hypothetical protein